MAREASVWPFECRRCVSWSRDSHSAIRLGAAAERACAYARAGWSVCAERGYGWRMLVVSAVAGADGGRGRGCGRADGEAGGGDIEETGPLDRRSIRWRR